MKCYNITMNLESVEEARKAYAKRLTWQWSIFIAIVLTLFMLCIASNQAQSAIMLFVYGFFAAFIYFIIMALANRTIHRKYRQAYKAYFVEQNLRKVFTDLSYSHESGLSSMILSLTGMINTGDRYSSNDFASGKYKDVAFSQADVHIETEYTDSDGDTHYTTIFRGRFMIFEFPKQFSFKLAVVGKRFRAYRKPGKNAKTGQKAEKITTESNEFNSMFRVFGQDGFEAYYILDPAFMVKLMDIATMHKRRVIFAFFENRLIVGLDDGKDSFEPPSPLKKIDEAKETGKIANDIKTITDFVDQLSLDRKLFTK